MSMYNLCRLCLKSSYYYAHIYIGQSSDKKPTYEVINYVYDLEISEGDGLPEYICCDCLLKLQEFESYKKNAQKARSELVILKWQMEKVYIKEEDNCQDISEKLTERLGKVDESRSEVWRSEEFISPDRDAMHGTFWTADATRVKVERLSDDEEDLHYTDISTSETQLNNHRKEYLNSTVVEEVIAVEKHVYNPSQSSFTDSRVIESQRYTCVEYTPHVSITGRLATDGESSVSMGNHRSEVEESCWGEEMRVKVEKEEYWEGEESCQKGRNQVKVEAYFPEDVLGADNHRNGTTEVKESCRKGSNQGKVEERLPEEVVVVDNRRNRTMEIGASCLGAEKSSMVQRMEVHYPSSSLPGKYMYPCTICYREFTSEHYLQKHYETHRKNKTHQCKLCGEVFTDVADLRRHRRVHRKELLCAHCGKKYYSKSVLVVHMRMHTGDRPFKCERCGKGFTQMGSLHSHYLTHMQRTTYTCEVCGRAFLHPKHLSSHMGLHTGERPFECTICGKKFTQSGILKAHVAIHSGRKPFACATCGKTFARMGHKKRHEAIHGK